MTSRARNGHRAAPGGRGPLLPGDGPTPRGPSPGTRLRTTPGATPLLLSSWLWHSSRWAGMFSSTYLVTDRTDAPLLNQFVGVAMFAPMVLGGITLGSLSDRVERRRLVTGTQVGLLPVACLMCVLVAAGVAPLWAVYPFTGLIGVGGLVNMVAQRPLIYDTVGPALASRALTVETMAAASASLTGSLVGGALVGAFGLGAGYALPVVALAASVLLLRRVPVATSPAAAPSPASSTSLRADVAEGVAALRSSRVLVSLLGITVIYNLCFSSFVPLVPAVAEDFGAGALLTGVLVGGVGAGQLLGGCVLAARGVRRRGATFTAGAVLSLLALGLFATAPVVGAALVALVVAGVGQACFGSMQSVLAMDAMGTARRGVAQGLLSTAIGVMPLGMVVVGLVAEQWGVRPSLLGSSVVGVAAMAWWVHRRPEVLGEATDERPGARRPWPSTVSATS